ncbi:MAG: hypothetical protein WCV50_03075 [Patescibacteria group bacterium]
MRQITSFRREENIAVTIITGTEGNTTTLEISKPDATGIRTITKNGTETYQGKILGHTTMPRTILKIVGEHAVGEKVPKVLKIKVEVGKNFTIQLHPDGVDTYHSRPIISIETADYD